MNKIGEVQLQEILSTEAIREEVQIGKITSTTSTEAIWDKPICKIQVDYINKEASTQSLLHQQKRKQYKP